jgi:hypothetical protein
LLPKSIACVALSAFLKIGNACCFRFFVALS